MRCWVASEQFAFYVTLTSSCLYVTLKVNSFKGRRIRYPYRLRHLITSSNKESINSRDMDCWATHASRVIDQKYSDHHGHSVSSTASVSRFVLNSLFIALLHRWDPFCIYCKTCSSAFEVWLNKVWKTGKISFFSIKCFRSNHRGKRLDGDRIAVPPQFLHAARSPTAYNWCFK